MPEDSSGPAEKAVYSAYDAAVQAAFKALVDCYEAAQALTKRDGETQQQFEARRGDAYQKCRDAFTSKVAAAGSALHDALTIIEKSEGKVPKPKHKAEWL